MKAELTESRDQPVAEPEGSFGGLSRQPHRGVIEQHVDDALFLAAQREAALHAPHLRLAQLLRLEERLEANLDGIRVAGEAGWIMLLQQADLAGPDSIFTMAAVALPGGDDGRIQLLLDASLMRPQLCQSLAAALGFLGAEAARPILGKLRLRRDSAAQQLSLMACARLGIDPGDRLFEAILSRDVPLQIAAFQTAAALGYTDLARYIVRSVGCADLHRSLHAALACARLGLRDEDVLETLRAAALRDLSPSPEALATAIACMPMSEAGRWIDELQEAPRDRRLFLTAVAALGEVTRIPALLALMSEPALARLSGAALSVITGLDLESASLVQPQPAGFEAGPNEDPGDPDVAPDPDEGLPWPAPQDLSSWWRKHAPAYAPGTRYLFGQAITRTSLLQVLLAGSQTQRHAAALQLALLEPAQPDFPLYAAAVRQRALLGGLIGSH